MQQHSNVLTHFKNFAKLIILITFNLYFQNIRPSNLTNIIIFVKYEFL